MQAAFRSSLPMDVGHYRCSPMLATVPRVYKACFSELLHLLCGPQDSRGCPVDTTLWLMCGLRLFAQSGIGSPVLHAASLLASTCSNFVLVSLLLLVACLESWTEFCHGIRHRRRMLSGISGKVRVLQDDSQGCMEDDLLTSREATSSIKAGLIDHLDF